MPSISPYDTGVSDSAYTGPMAAALQGPGNALAINQAQQGENQIAALKGLDPNDSASVQATMGALVRAGATDKAVALGNLAQTQRLRAAAYANPLTPQGNGGSLNANQPVAQQYGPSPQASTHAPPQASASDPQVVAATHAKVADSLDQLASMAPNERQAAMDQLVQQHAQDWGLDPSHPDVQALMDHVKNDPDGGYAALKAAAAQNRQAAAAVPPEITVNAPSQKTTTGLTVAQANQDTGQQALERNALMNTAALGNVDYSGEVNEANRALQPGQIAAETNAVPTTLVATKTFTDSDGHTYEANQGIRFANGNEANRFANENRGNVGSPGVGAGLQTSAAEPLIGTNKNTLATTQYTDANGLVHTRQTTTQGIIDTINGGQPNGPARDTLVSPAQTLEGGVRSAESGGQDYRPDGSPMTSAKGALYAMQVMPSTAANPGYGIAPARNNSAAEYDRVGQQYLAAMSNQFGGDQIKALAAYNAGPAAVQAAVSQYGTNWLAHMPSETQNYVSKIAGSTPASGAAAGGSFVPGFDLPTATSTAVTQATAGAAAAPIAARGVAAADTITQDNKNFQDWAKQYVGPAGDQQKQALQQQVVQDKDIAANIHDMNSFFYQRRATIDTFFQRLGLNPATSPQNAINLLRQRFGGVNGLNVKDPEAVLRYAVAYDQANANYKAAQIDSVQKYAAARQQDGQPWSAADQTNQFNKQFPAGIYSNPQDWAGVANYQGHPYVRQSPKSGIIYVGDTNNPQVFKPQ